MSGHKRTTVTISQEEYRRLYEAEQRNIYGLFELPEESVYQTQQSTHETLMNQYQQLADRQLFFEHIASGLQNQLREVELSTSRSLVQQQVDHYNRMIEDAGRLWENSNRIFTERQNELAKEIHIHQDRLVEISHAMQQRFTSFELRIDKQRQLALDWLKDCLSIRDFIQSCYPQELIEPSRKREIRHLLQTIEYNIQNEVYEAAIVAGQTAYQRLSELRLVLEERKNNLDTILMAVTDKYTLLLGQCQANRLIKAIDLQGDEIDEWLDVDAWTGGMLSKVENEIHAVLERLNGNVYGLTKTEALSLGNETFQDLSQSMATAIHEARRCALNAQIRFNTAQMVLLALTNQGYQPETGEFAANNYLQEYIACAKSMDGSSITIRVSPWQDLSNHLEIISSSRTLTSDHEMQRRSIEIAQSLQSLGLQTAPMEVVKANPTPQKRVKEQSASYVINQV